MYIPTKSKGRWDCFDERVLAFLSALHLEEALELEGHHFPIITGVHWEGHPVTGGLRQHARRGRLTEFGPRIAGTSLGGQKRTEVRHCTLPVLVITGGKTDRSSFLCRHGLPRLRRPVVDRAFVIPAMPVVVKGSHPSRGRCRPILLAVSLLPPTQVVVFLGQGVFGMRNWNVVSLSTSHAYALAVTCQKGVNTYKHNKSESLYTAPALSKQPHRLPQEPARATCRNTSLDRPSPRAAFTKTAPAYLFVVVKWAEPILLGSSTGLRVLGTALDLLLTALLCPARPRVFMCQRALFCRGTELNINSPRNTMLTEVGKTAEGKKNIFNNRKNSRRS